jgi:hypothetical protein
MSEIPTSFDIGITSLAHELAGYFPAGSDPTRDARMDALEARMLASEPATAGEALSLALVLHTELDTFAAKYCPDPQADEEAEAIIHGLRALARYLAGMKGVESPLQRSYGAPWLG